MAEPHWEHFPHEADMGVRGFGKTKAEAFEQAALGLIAVITDPKNVRSEQRVEIVTESPDDEIGLYDWLNALIYEMATRKLLFNRFNVLFEGRRLRGEAWGEPVDRVRHQPAVEVKGATFTGLKVEQDRSNGWMVQCVVDV